MLIKGRIENFVLIIDCSDIGVFNAPYMTFGNVMKTVQNYYKCKLRAIFCLNTSETFKHVLWKTVVLDEVSSCKVVMTNKNSCPELRDMINPTQLEKKFGGCAPNVLPEKCFPPKFKNKNFGQNKLRSEELLFETNSKRRISQLIKRSYSSVQPNALLTRKNMSVTEKGRNTEDTKHLEKSRNQDESSSDDSEESDHDSKQSQQQGQNQSSSGSENKEESPIKDKITTLQFNAVEIAVEKMKAQLRKSILITVGNQLRLQLQNQEKRSSVNYWQKKLETKEKRMTEIDPRKIESIILQ